MHGAHVLHRDLSSKNVLLTAPPPQSNTEGAIMESQPEGAELLFYWSTFVIRLCFGSFIVAILAVTRPAATPHRGPRLFSLCRGRLMNRCSATQ